MSYVCIICDENLAYDSQPNKTSKYGKITTTICGHVYHGHCLEEWFDASKKERERELRESNNSNSSHTRKRKMQTPSEYAACPICQARIFLYQCIKIFPSEEYGSNALSKKMREKTNVSSAPSPSTSKTNIASCSSTSKWEDLTSLENTTETAKGGLVIGDIVVWFREDGKDIGSVIWMGTLEGVLNACVKFISPIGEVLSTEIKEKELINYDSKYCKMLPVSELILYVDCFGYEGVENNDSNPA